jgi:cobalamin biosynthesis Mg chelatase CobN
MVLWGTDNMKSEGTPLAQALALMGAVPRFDAVGRLAGARLVPLEQLGRPRVDVVVTLSGIFRDLLPLQVKLLAEAALLAASADEPEERNFVRGTPSPRCASWAWTSRPPPCACSATPTAPTARTSTCSSTPASGRSRTSWPTSS